MGKVKLNQMGSYVIVCNSDFELSWINVKMIIFDSSLFFIQSFTVG